MLTNLYRPFSMLLAAAALVAPGCAVPTDLDVDQLESHNSRLTSRARRLRAMRIRDQATLHGLTNGWLLAAIADGATGLAYCKSEAAWACEGPPSADCGGGPIVAGTEAGPCAAREGGLGMFQIDHGDHDDTLAREGERILTLDGSIEAAVDRSVAMLQESRFVDVSTRTEALEFMNRVRPGSDGYHEWLQTLTAYADGCPPGECSVYETRYADHDKTHRELVTEMGENFWFDDTAERVWVHPTGEARWVKEFNVRNPSLNDYSVCFRTGLRTLTHAGEDWGRPAYTPVVAIGDGVVVSSYNANYPGHVVLIEHQLTSAEQEALALPTRTLYSQYGHIFSRVSAGQTVRAGDVIGTIWNQRTASNDNSHLHWEVRTFDVSPICQATYAGPGYSGPGTDATEYGWLDPGETLAILRSAGDAAPPGPTCGDEVCDDTEDCTSCSSDCGECGGGCGVSGHLDEGEGGDPCNEPEAWRCAYSTRQESWTSQVCRSGQWLVYRRHATECGDCCGAFSRAC